MRDTGAPPRHRWAPRALAVCLALASCSAAASGEPPRVEVLATGLQAPWALAFAADGRLFVTERAGRIRVLRNGRLQDAPAGVVPVAPRSSGLMGLALDPAFARNGHVFVCYMAPRGEGRVGSRLSRFTLRAGAATEERILQEGHAGVGTRNGCRVKIGPDGKVYATMGDAGVPALASPAGKILRLNRDGTIPVDNPFPGSPVFALGFRNPQGIAWDVGGRLFAAEHGPVGHDEIDVLRAGGDYGWPRVLGRGGEPRFVDPLIESGADTWAPSGIAVLGGELYVATLRGRRLLRIPLPREGAAPRVSSVLDGAYGRLRDVVAGTDGRLYVATSNRDARGSPAPDDDRILRVRP